jgi:hypothetical protein
VCQVCLKSGHTADRCGIVLRKIMFLKKSMRAQL